MDNQTGGKPKETAQKLPQSVGTEESRKLLGWLQKRYPGASGVDWKSDESAGAVLLAADECGMTLRQRKALSLDSGFGLSRKTVKLLLADAGQGGEKARTWAAIQRGDAVLYRDPPPPWSLPTDDFQRIVMGAEAAGIFFTEVVHVVGDENIISEAAGSILLQTICDVLDSLDRGEDPDLDVPPPPMSVTCGECGSSHQGAKHGGNDVVGTNDEILERHRDEGADFFPPELREWIYHIEALVMAGRMGILSLATHGEPISGGNVLSVDLQHKGGGVQWGYEHNTKAILALRLKNAVADDGSLGAVLRVFTGERDDLIGQPLKEVRGWFVHVTDSCATAAHGRSAGEMQRSNETDPASDGLLEPEFGVSYVAARDFLKLEEPNTDLYEAETAGRAAESVSPSRAEAARARRNGANFKSALQWLELVDSQQAKLRREERALNRGQPGSNRCQETRQRVEKIRHKLQINTEHYLRQAREEGWTQPGVALSEKNTRKEILEKARDEGRL